MSQLSQILSFPSKQPPIESEIKAPHTNRHGSGNGGGDDMQGRVARLEADIEYIKRDIAEVKTDIKAIDSRLTTIETGIGSIKTTLKATCAVISIVFAFCVYIFGSYVSKILDALNGLVLK
ncbi:hemolysin XhlA [Kluyvera intermedia]|uniref:hemolysin XhlA n=1 Tax=Kluyvera intermedia TaxID=61648 RepID=UPI00370ACA9A